MIATIPPLVLIHMRNRRRHFRRAIAEMGPSGLDGAFSIVHTSSRTNGGRPSFISGHGRQARFVTRLHSSQRSTEIGATPVPAPKARGGPSNLPTCSRLEKSERSSYWRDIFPGASMLEIRYFWRIHGRLLAICCTAALADVEAVRWGRSPCGHSLSLNSSCQFHCFTETVSLAAITPTALEHFTQATSYYL